MGSGVVTLEAARNRVLVALDVGSAEDAVRMARSLVGRVGGFKVGLELMMGPGPAVVSAVAELGSPVFADAKLHDIPNTVGRAAASLSRAGARWITAHAGGGADMVRAAVDGAGANGEARVLGVTVLTSLDEAMLAATGVAGSVGRQVARLTRLVADCGVEGVVCAVRELGDVAQVAPDLIRVTPGIRPSGTESHDQKRTATPAEAVRRGATYLVIGRSITSATDPPAAADAIVEEIASVGDPSDIGDEPSEP